MNQTLNQISKEQFMAMYHTLPEDVKLSLFAEETAQKMLDMKNKHSLSDESFSSIVRITGRIMLGLINVKLFIQVIADIAKLDSTKAQAIAQDINQAIFQPVKQSLMAVHGLAERGPTPIQTPINAEKYTHQMTNDQAQMTNQAQNPNGKKPQPTNNDYEARRRREEVLSKLKAPRNGPPAARPANYYRIPRKNIVDLKRSNRKNGYNGFFSA